jgi:carboxypeptidase T
MRIAAIPPGAGGPIGVVALSCALGALAATEAPDDRRTAVEADPITGAELALVLDLGVDVWTEQPEVYEPVVIVVTPLGLDLLGASGIPYRVVVDDIDAAAAAERARLAHRAQAADWFAEYRDLEEVGAFLDALAGHHPGVASVRHLGASIEGRSIRALEVSRGGPIRIALNGAQHAREWISVMVPTCIADRLVTGDATDARIRRILDAVSFTIVPIVNPDGYAYSWTSDRYWRKNRRGSYGVDLNRNFSVAWGGRGSSDSRRSQNYRGEHAFSEPESRAMRDLFAGGRYAAHVDFHSFSQLLLYPWSHTRDEPPDAAEYGAIADRMASAMFATHGERYQIRRGADLMFGASGTLGDWVYGEAGALSLLVELRPPPGRGGFVLPPDQIVPTCEENLAAVLELAEWMIDHPREPR